MLKKEKTSSGMVCSIISIWGIKYPDIVKLIGEPHSFEGKDGDGYPIIVKWLFTMYTGDKVEFRCDRDEASFRKLIREKLKRTSRDTMENCDYLTIKGNTDSTVIIATLLKHQFPKAEFEGRREIGDKHYIIRKVYE